MSTLYYETLSHGDDFLMYAGNGNRRRYYKYIERIPNK